MYVGILFAILSPAIYAIVNYFDKFFLARYKLEPIIITVFSGFITFFLSFLFIIIFGFHTFPLSTVIIIILSGILTELFLLPYFSALSLEDASTVIPLLQFAPIFIIFGDAFFLGGRLTEIQYIGTIFIIVSGLVLSLERFNTVFLRPRKAFWYMLFACLLFAIGTLFFKYAVDAKNFWYVLPYEGVGIFIGALIILVTKHHYRYFISKTSVFPNKLYILMIINEGFYMLARYFGLFALSLVSASIVGVLSGMQPFFVLIYGLILSFWFPHIIKEKINKKLLTLKFVSIFGIILGVALLSI